MSTEREEEEEEENEGERNKRHFIGNIDLTVLPVPIQDCKDITPSLKLILMNIQQRLSYLERALASSTQIIKAKPLLSLIYQDNLCKTRIDSIYNNWIKYMNHIARYNISGLSMQQCFWLIDRFIFEDYFETISKEWSILIQFVALSKSKPFQCPTEDMHTALKNLLAKERHLDETGTYNLRNPSDKEYFSFTIYKNIMYVAYFPEELKSFIAFPKVKNAAGGAKNGVDTDTDTDTDTDVRDVQWYHPDSGSSRNKNLSSSNSVIDSVYTNTIGVKNKDSRLKMAEIDKRLLVLGASQRVLYNTIVNVDYLNDFDENLHSMGIFQFNVSLALFHAMLHMKCCLRSVSFEETNNNNYCDRGETSRHNHDKSFLEEFLSHTPTVLYGHFLFPPLTVKDNIEI